MVMESSCASHRSRKFLFLNRVRNPPCGLAMSIEIACEDLRLLSGGGSTLLLSHQRLPGNNPAFPRASQPPQFARSYFQNAFACRHNFHDKGPLDASAANIANNPFRLNQFIQLPPTQLLRRPHLVLAPHAVVQLLVPMRNTAVVKNACSGLHHLSHCTSNGNRVVGVRLGQVQDLNTLVFGFLPVGALSAFCIFWVSKLPTSTLICVTGTIEATK